MPSSNGFTSSPALLFARNFFKHPKMLGSLLPSSPFLVKNLLSRIDWEKARVLVEYGPGIGNISEEIVKRMHSEARLVLIETNGEFARYLQHKFASDGRVAVVHGSAADVAQALSRFGIAEADYIISGIPYSTMPTRLRRKILLESRRVLQPEGAFLVYQFTRTVLPYLEPVFGRVDQDFEPRNILPARLFYCTP